MSLALTSRKAALLAPWQRNPLWAAARAVPSLDLRFAESKSLVDATTGQNLVTFTRASGGTYVDSQGVIRNATTNLLLRSEEFDNATAWASLAAGVTRTANYEAAPNGTNTADRLEFSGADTGINQVVTSAINGAVYTASVYIRGTAGQTVRLTGVNFGTASNVTLASGWQRFSISGTATSTAVSFSISTFGGATARDISIWGAQLEQSSTVGEYIPTGATINSAPRFDHNPTTGESLGLLVEEARTNSIRNNTMVGAVAGTPGTLPTNWSESLAGLTREVVAVGTQNGINYIDLRFSGTSTGTLIVIRWTGAAEATASDGQTLTHSVWASLVSGSLPSGNIVLVSNLFTSGGAYITDFAALNIKPSITGSLSRFSVAGTINSPTAAFARPYIYFLMANGETVDFTLRIGMPQLEQGAFATSVIPTTGTAATRSADVASITDGVGSGSNFSSWFSSPGENTFYAEYQKPPGTGQIIEGYDGGNIVGMSLSLASTAPRTTARHGPSRFDSGTNGLPPYIAGTNKHTGATSASGSAAAANGTVLTTGTTSQSDWTASSSLSIGHRGAYSSDRCNTPIKRITFWPQRLPNTTLQAITQ